MKINDNTKVKVRIPKDLYESVKKELAKKSIQESKALQAKKSQIDEDVAAAAAMIPAAVAGLGISAVALKQIFSIMKEKDLKGISGFNQAWKEWKSGQGDVAKKF